MKEQNVHVIFFSSDQFHYFRFQVKTFLSFRGRVFYYLRRCISELEKPIGLLNCFL